MICGGRGISGVEKIVADKVICEMLNLDKVPDISTISRFCNRYGKEEKAIGFLGDYLSEIGLEGLKREGIKEVSVDQDATYNEVYKREAKRCYKGFKAYSSLMCFIDELGYCIDEDFREGNVAPSKGLLSQLKKVHGLLERHGIKLSRYRSDSAGYKASIINYCFSKGIEFYIGADLDISIKNGIWAISPDSWRPYRDGISDVKQEISEFIHSMEKSEESFRIIVIRKETGSVESPLLGRLEINYKYRVIATNSQLPAEEVVRFYDKRGRCEYYIKEAKYGFDLKHLPCNSLEGNKLWFKIGMLAYNLITYFKNIILRGNYRYKQLISIRYQIFCIAGKLVKHARKKILKLCCSQNLLEKFNRWRRLCLSL